MKTNKETNLREEIFNIVRYQVGILPGKDEKAVDQILELIEKTVKEVIGENEYGEPTDSEAIPRVLGNRLRSYQRKYLDNLLKQKGK